MGSDSQGRLFLVGTFGVPFPPFVFFPPIDESYIHKMTGSHRVIKPKPFQDQTGEPSKQIVLSVLGLPQSSRLRSH